MLRYRRFLWQHRKTLWAWNLRRRTVSQGFIDGRTVWQIAGVILYGGRTIRRVLGKQPEMVATVRIEPGAAVQIQTIDPRSERSG